MSAFLAGGVEGVSARYAAQIRELLYAQAIRRMAADEEAARAEAAAAERSARIEKLTTPRVEEPVKVEIESAPAAELADPVRQPAGQEAPPAAPLAQIIDVQA